MGLKTKQLKPVYLNKQLASKESGLSVRRLLELANAGKIRKTHSRDPKSKRDIALFDADDIRRLAERPAPGSNLQISGAVRARDAATPLPANAPFLFPFQQPAWMSVPDAAIYTGLPGTFLLIQIKSGKLPAFDVGPRAGGRYRVSRTALEKLEAPTLVCGGKRKAK